MSGRWRVLDEPTAVVSVVDETTRLVTLPGVAAVPPSANNLSYTYSNVSMWPPNAGQLRTDTDDPAQSTRLWFSRQTENGVDAHRLLLAVDAADVIDVQDEGDSSAFSLYVVAAPAVDFGSYVEIPVARERGGSPLQKQKRVIASILWR